MDSYEIEHGIIIPRGRKVLVFRDTLIIADLHLGYESEMEKEGVYLPRLQLREAINEINEVIPRYNISRVIVAGDLKHRFDALTWQERAEIEKLINFLREKGISDIIWVRGNHDTFIKGIVERLNIKLIEDLLELNNSIAVTHGHLKLETYDLCRYKYIVMGHEHPVVNIRLGGSTTTRFPVLLNIPFEDCSTRLIILPALGIYQSGNPISLNREDYLSPIIQKYGLLEEAKIYIVDSEMILELPELKYLKNSMIVV